VVSGADLYVLGSDDSVCSGQGDRLRAAGHLVVGPNADGGQLEGLQTVGEVIARRGWCADGAPRLIRRRRSSRGVSANAGGRILVKTDYLALGKGVLVTDDLNEAIRTPL
jgi:phosphoribosylamine--glycine ligase